MTSSSRWVASLALLTSIACSIAKDDPVEHGETRLRTPDGGSPQADTNDLPHSNAVVFLHDSATPLDPNVLVVGKCSGTLIAPNVVLTAKHCVAQGSGMGPQPFVHVGTRADMNGHFLRRSKGSASKTATAVVTASENLQPIVTDLALVFLDTVGLDEEVAIGGVAGSTWDRIFRVDVRRPTFIANYTPPNLVYTTTIPTNRGVAGWGRFAEPLLATEAWERTRLLGSELVTLGIQAQYQLFQEVYASISFAGDPYQLEGGDSGGPLFLTDPDGFRDVKGVAFGRIDLGSSREYVWVDITAPENAAWIKEHARDPSHDNQPNWIAKHATPLVNGLPDRWYGEVEYLGECDQANDDDCDHWRNGKDNCRYTWNPDQADENDDVVGDACSPGKCTCDTLGDADGDGVCAIACRTTLPGVLADNCPNDFNPHQANCNAAAEKARQSGLFGDVCDPVPCPTTDNDEVSDTTITCLPNPDDGCTEVAMHADLATTALGAHYATALDRGVHKVGDPLLGAFKSVRDVNTRGRYCNTSLTVAPLINCTADASIGDDKLGDPDTSRVSPWHKVTLGYQNGVNPPSPLPYGTDWQLDYDGTSSTRHWTYDLDVKRWFADLQNPWIAGGGSSCDKESASLCIPGGALWIHSDSDIGSTAVGADQVDGVTVGRHGDQLSNNYFLSDAETKLKFCYAHLPALLMYTPPSAPKLQTFGSAPVLVESSLDLAHAYGHPRSAAEFVIPIGDGDLAQAGTSDTALTSVRFNLANRSACGPQRATNDLVMALATNVLSDPTDASSAPASASNTIATELRADGTEVVGVVQEANGILSHLALVQPLDNRPSPRSRFVALYSAVRHGTFMLGGENGGQAEHDVWFAPVGEGWTEITPVQGGSLQEVFAATYSFGDGRLWILDAPSHGATGGQVRLVTLGIEKRDMEVVATWPHTRLTYSYGLSTDQDGGVLLQATNGSSASVIAKVGTSNFTKLDNESFALARAVAVDRHGYSFLTRAGAAGVRVVRHSAVGGSAAAYTALEPWF